MLVDTELTNHWVQKHQTHSRYMLLELVPDAGTGLPAPPHFLGWVLCLPRTSMNLDLTLLPAQGTVLISALCTDTQG